MQDLNYRSIDDVGMHLPYTVTSAAEPVVDAAALESIAFAAGLTRGQGIVAAAQEVVLDPSRKLKAILGVLKLLVFERAQQALDNISATFPRIDCKSGCSFCCYQRVEVTIPEAILVFAHVSDPVDPRHRKILDQSTIIAGLYGKERLDHLEACPLLVEQRCSVYEDRPLMCRGVISSAAEQCQGAYEDRVTGRDERPIQLYPLAQCSVFGDQAAVRGVCKDMGLQFDLVELTLAVGAMIRDPAIIDRWLAGERAFGPELSYHYQPSGQPG